MKKLLQFGGLAGAMLFVLGVVVAVVQQGLTTISVVHLLIGGALTVAGVVANGAEIKEYLSRRTVRMGPQVVIQAGLLLVVLLLVNLVASRYDRQVDTTDRELYTLSPPTLSVGGSLPGPVRVIASLPGGGAPDTRQRLQLYARSFPNFKLISIDPDKNEDIARSEKLPPQAGIMFKHNDREVWITKFDESEITNALIKVTRKFSPKVWFSSGHLEPALKDSSPAGLSSLAESLTMQGFQLESVDLSVKTDVPPDVSLIAIIGPTIPFTSAEVKLLDFYLNQGGAVIILLDPLLDPRAATGLESFVRAYGVEADPNIVFDPQNHLSRDSTGLWIVPQTLHDHPITSQLSGNRAVVYMSRGLRIASQVPSGTEIVPLITTSDSAFAKVPDLQAVVAMTPEQSKAYFERLLGQNREGASPAGTQALALLATNKHSPPNWKRVSELDREWEMRLIVFGGSSIARNMSFNMPFNNEIITNAFNWIAGTIDLQSIATKTRGADRLILDVNQMNMILYLSVLIMPELFMMIGLAMWWRKR